MGTVVRWLAVISFLGAIVYFTVVPRIVTQARVQPLRFSHEAHFEDATCEACHLYVMESASAGVPTLEDCVDCHDGPQSDTPENQAEEKKFQMYVEEEREIPWARLPPLPDHTYFSHYRHASLEEIECAKCHGNIAKTMALPGRPPYKFTMDWCMDCHEEHEASNDCLLCHH